MAYVEARSILSVEVYAELGDDLKEFDQAMVEPLASPFKLPDGKVFEVTATDMPVVRARLRHAWMKKAREKLAPNAAPATTSSGSASTPFTATKAKELPPGFWQAQVRKYEAVTIHGVPRKFPEFTLLGAEATLARLLNDSKNLCHNAIPLEEIVQHRHFTAALLPNALSSARKCSRSQEQVTTLVVNSDLQLETEPETPWKPKSQVAILDCLEAIRVALIFIEYVPESDIDDYFAWWHRLVRSRPNKIDQLKLHWENTSWRIALALRKKMPFKDIAKEIMNDNQLLQEAMNAEIPPERPTKTHRGLDSQWADQQRGGKGKGKGKSWSKQQRWGDQKDPSSRAFAQLVVDLEKRWQHGRAVLLVENVIPQNRADVRKIEKMLDAPAIVHDAADFGTISRPRVWWCRVPWQEIAHRTECPLKLRWTTMQGIPRARFDVVKDDPQSFETGGLALPRCLTEEQKPLPCLTTPSDDPQGRPAPRSSKGKISSEANQRWRADRQRFAPWH